MRYRFCSRHMDAMVDEVDGEFRCRMCYHAGESHPILTPKQVWDEVSVPSLRELIASVDEAIMDFLWAENDGTLINLYLYFNSEREPLDPREFLQFWGSLSEEEQKYYMSASAEALRNEAKGEN